MKVMIELIIVTICIIAAVFAGALMQRLYIGESPMTPRVMRIGKVGCGSDSMGLTLGCNDTTFSIDVKEDDQLALGHIYIFRSPYVKNETLIHRLVACVDSNCSKLIFKGDNNPYADPQINRTDVLYRVMRTEYSWN